MGIISQNKRCNLTQPNKSGSVCEVTINDDQENQENETNDKRCKEKLCKVQRIICEFMDLIKIIKQNLINIKRYCLGKQNIEEWKCVTTIEPTYVLAHLTAKILEFEKRLKRLKCNKNDNCRLAMLMKCVKQNIVKQFICGPRVNEELIRTVREVAYIDCLLKCLEDTVKTSDKGVNTCIMLDRVQKADKSTIYDIQCEHYKLDCKCLLTKRWLYTYRRINGTKATEFGCYKKNLKYYYDVCQINRCTSTSDIQFEGNIKYPDEIECIDDSQFNLKQTFEITTLCISYKHENIINELDELPVINNITNDYFESTFYGEKQPECLLKTYMNRLDGMDVIAETKTENHIEELTLIYNSDIAAAYPSSGQASPQIDSSIIAFKNMIFYQAKEIAQKFINSMYQE